MLARNAELAEEALVMSCSLPSYGTMAAPKHDASVGRCFTEEALKVEIGELKNTLLRVFTLQPSTRGFKYRRQMPSQDVDLGL